MLRDSIPGRFVAQSAYFDDPVTYNVYQGRSDDPKHLSYDRMWATQPNLRTVVDFYARNISQLGLHTFMRDGDSSERVRDNRVARLLSKPNAQTTGPEMVYALVADIALYDEGYLWVRPNIHRDELYDIHVLPAASVTRNKARALSGPESYTVTLDDAPVTIPAEQILDFKGWTPGDPTKGTSPVDTLRMILDERRAAEKYRAQLWKSAGRIGGIFRRPADAPAWSDTARGRFMRMVRDYRGNNGARSGEDMLIEDGMTYDRVALVAKEEQFVEAAKLSLETVAQVYQINPTMIGLLDNANFSNVREFRRGLYGDTLGPAIVKIEARLNTFLLPMLDEDTDTYVEFNVEAKLRGSFEEQAKVMSASVGGPWQTRNEARKLMNYPAIVGGDDLIVPKNVSEGGQASPVDGGDVSIQYGGTHQQTTDEAIQGEASGAESALFKFLEYQFASVNSRIGAGRDDWWDGKRWSKVLTQALEGVGVAHEEAVFKSDQINTKIRDHFEQHGGTPVDVDDIKPLLA